ncbi:cytochrome c oxidase subunit 4 isoform 1, mitochondrial [Calliopsis andreniformis]|uniref:cytochrome c oxidase subunit 4 isoform 1, mitochondrial n=1 Tax=Calliopsis andreniformis TaxID=337506 RepID=UPI003FCEA030
MAGKLFLSCLRQKIPANVRGMSSTAVEVHDKIGNRDIVGYGSNGEITYLDRTDYPMPAVRFKANTSDVMALREKEKGDWKKLSIEEKKALYRASFCQTFAEIDAPSGEWKGDIGITLMGVALTLWLCMFFKQYVLPPLPITFDEDRRLAQLERMKILEMNPITGISSKP